MRNVERLCLAHFWVAFAAFLVASLLGAWQMWVRSPLGANIGTPSQYFLSVTAHGVAMAYVLTTFFIMGFGYFVAVTALARPLPYFSAQRAAVVVAGAAARDHVEARGAGATISALARADGHHHGLNFGANLSHSVMRLKSDPGTRVSAPTRILLRFFGNPAR